QLEAPRRRGATRRRDGLRLALTVVFARRTLWREHAAPLATKALEPGRNLRRRVRRRLATGCPGVRPRGHRRTTPRLLLRRVARRDVGGSAAGTRLGVLANGRRQALRSLAIRTSLAGDAHGHLAAPRPEL